MGDGVTGVTRQKAEHEGNPLAGLTKRIRSKGMRDETGPGTSKGKGSEGHARNSALCAPEGARRNTGTRSALQSYTQCYNTQCYTNVIV